MELASGHFTPVSQTEAAWATGVHCRQTNPCESCSFLRCQMGQIVGKDEGGRPIFHLHAHGRDWPECHSMWRKRKLGLLEAAKN